MLFNKRNHVDISEPWKHNLEFRFEIQSPNQKCYQMAKRKTVLEHFENIMHCAVFVNTPPFCKQKIQNDSNNV